MLLENLPDLTKRYWVFDYEFVRTDGGFGGLEDITLTTDDLDIAAEHHAFSTYDDSYIFDSVERKIV